MAKKINLTHENRKAYDRYIEVQALRKALEKEEKELKAQLEKAFTDNNESTKTNGTTDFIISTIQRAGKAVHVVFKKTIAKGTVDWQAAYKSIGGTEEYAEQFRRADTVRTVIEEASEKQLAKYGELSEA
jgi:hypothetical protein